MTRSLRPGHAWAVFWMTCAGRGPLGRLATRLAVLRVPPYKGREYLARLTSRGYVDPTAALHHPDVVLGPHVFIGERVVIYRAHRDAGPVALGSRVHLHRDTIVEVGRGGRLEIGADTHVQPRCQFAAFEAPIVIGAEVQIAPACAFYPYDHGFAPGIPIRRQPLRTRGGIVVDDDAWLGVGVTVLDGVRIGRGAVIGAGAVVTRDIPDGAIAAGVPARVVGGRDDSAAKPKALRAAAAGGGRRA